MTTCDISGAAQWIKNGEVVAFPTETVYGLGANALDEKAVQKIYTIKGRPSQNPLIVHVLTASDAQKLVSEWPNTATQLANHFWPGPLTIVLKKNPIVPDITTAGSDTVALRSPAHPIARRLLELAQVPIAAPSANASGQLSPVRAEHVHASLPDQNIMILDGGQTENGIESTVVDLTTSPPRLLRPGPITADDLISVIGPIDSYDQHAKSDDTTPLPSPGLMTRHYAPHTPLIVSSTPIEDANMALSIGKKVGLVTISTFKHECLPTHYRALGQNPTEAAHNLYDILHELDEYNMDILIVEKPPENGEWTAIHDRLQRASAE